MSAVSHGSCSKTICWACILVMLTAILYGCERSDSDKKNRIETRINSVASLKQYSVGKWCVLNQEDDRLMKIVVGNSGRYVLYFKATTSNKNWERMREGAILYGQGRYTTDGTRYYYIHLSGTAINFGITAGTPVAMIVRKGMPVWFYYEPQSGPEIKLQWANHNCSV